MFRIRHCLTLTVKHQLIRIKLYTNDVVLVTYFKAIAASFIIINIINNLLRATKPGWQVT